VARPVAPDNPEESTRDLVGLRVIARLGKEHGVPTRQLRKLGEWLRERYDAPWSTLRFYVAGRQLFFDAPETSSRSATRQPGQTAFPIEMQAIADEMQEASARLRQRDPEDIGKIDCHRYVLGGAPGVKGTRIPTSVIWEFHEAGRAVEAILREYPTLSREDVLAAISLEGDRRRQKKAG
jgi:uncharacterized protein (DUF433 family)